MATAVDIYRNITININWQQQVYMRLRASWKKYLRLSLNVSAYSRYILMAAKSSIVCSWLDLCQWESELSIKSLDFKDTLQNSIEHASYAHVSEKIKVPNFWKSPKKTILGPMLGQYWLEKSSGRFWVRSGEIPSPWQTSIDKTNDCVMNSEQSAPVRGSDPP